MQRLLGSTLQFFKRFYSDAKKTLYEEIRMGLIFVFLFPVLLIGGLFSLVYRAIMLVGGPVNTPKEHTDEFKQLDKIWDTNEHFEDRTS